MDKSTENVACFARRLGDDSLIMGQRLCEWTSRAPMLEEDLALSNVALDYLGRSRMFYGYAGESLGQTEDELAFLRSDREFENVLIVELPRGDFAFTMVRQFLLDEFESRYFAALAHSKDAQLAAISEKVNKEVAYHLRRSQVWLRRLGLGTAESNRRAQAALEELWAYVDELFEVDELERELIQSGIAVERAGLKDDWLTSVAEQLAAVELQVPTHGWQVAGGREGVHSEHLGHLLTELQFLQRAHPGLSW